MNTDGDGGLDFDAFLERELRRRVGGISGPRPLNRQAAYRAVGTTGRRTMPLLSSLAAAASSKAVVGLAAAALVVGGGTAAAAVASDSANPADWGKTVTAAVATCKSQLSGGQHGIGQCVSAIASRKGQQERDAHAAGASQQNHSSGRPSPHSTGADRTHSTGASTHGKSTDVPVGPPSIPPTSGGSHPTGPPVTAPTPTPHHQ
ncbi:MAG TPA: hypothetical protein VLW53_20215 [Candidatus Eisenbacteria bacterium]|nr:hypothetical protein [Candidatus Eisenbacteria bacterium]